MNTNQLFSRVLVALCFSTFGLTSLSAQVPSTDLFLFQLVKDDTSRWHIHSPQLLSGFNIDGYTNQPEFINDDLLFVSVNMPGDAENDIFSLDLDNFNLTQITDSPESEFSPLLTPSGTEFSCVRQVHGDSVDQQLFRYPVDLSYPGQAALPEVKTVGYHCWLTDSEVALFLVGDPVRLALANTRTSRNRIVASNIGRSLRRMDDGKLAFIHKYSPEFWYLKALDPATRRSDILIQSLEGQEDFAIGPGGEFFMGKDSVLYVFDQDHSDSWRPVMDLSIYGIETITRLAINSRYQIALVSRKP